MATLSLLPLFVITGLAFVASFLFKRNARWTIVAFASISYLFFSNPLIAITLLALSSFNYLFLKKTATKSKLSHQVVIGFNLIFLLYFKLVPILSVEGYLIPIGISIFTFQQISILVDIMQRKGGLPPFNQFLSYSFFFGNFATGPIFIFSDLINTHKQHLYFSSRNLQNALLIILFGLFKIFAVAGNLSILTAPLFSHSDQIRSDLLLPFLFNKYEIFANFSGYTDIAMGIGLLFGIQLPQNFNKPFHTVSIIEFWKRWHMSLSAWIRKYVFYPLLTTRFSKLGVFPLMLITFLVFGFWHGVKATYILYALTQVIFIYLTYKWREQINFKPHRKLLVFFKVGQWLWFYVILISIPGLLFRSDSLKQFYKIINQIRFSSIEGTLSFTSTNATALLMGLISIIVLEIIQYVGVFAFNKPKTLTLNILKFAFILAGIFLLGQIASNYGFIYSQH